MSSVNRASLHEHLDGCVLPETLIELAPTCGLHLPHTDPAALSAWIQEQVQGSLAQYLSCFALTTAVLQNEEALERVAYEHVAQLAADSVSYAEVRFAPQLHNMPMARSIAAVVAGLKRADEKFSCRTGLIICGMRDGDPDLVVKTATAAASATSGTRSPVCGFDLAGQEAGFLPTIHRRALDVAREAGLGITIHAGEAAGAESVEAALDCGATRIGHGVRVIEQVAFKRGCETGIRERLTHSPNPPMIDELEDLGVILGPTARRVMEERTHLEVCISSNIDTQVFAAYSAHPAVLLARLGFALSLSTDNRLMSHTSLVNEERLAVDVLGATADEIAALRANAHAAAFLH